MIAITTAKELISEIRMGSQIFKSLKIVESIIPSIVEKSGLRDAEEIFDYLLQSSYQVLPLPVRMLIKEDVYVQSIKESKLKVIELIDIVL